MLLSARAFIVAIAPFMSRTHVALAFLRMYNWVYLFSCSLLSGVIEQDDVLRSIFLTWKMHFFNYSYFNYSSLDMNWAFLPASRHTHQKKQCGYEHVTNQRNIDFFGGVMGILLMLEAFVGTSWAFGLFLCVQDVFTQHACLRTSSEFTICISQMGFVCILCWGSESSPCSLDLRFASLTPSCWCMCG